MRFWPDLVLKQPIIKGKVSTDRFDEDWTLPGSTLSLLIVQFHPSGPVYETLALNTRLNGLSIRLALAACLEVAA